MVNAIILIKAQRSAIPETAQKVLAIDRVTEVYSVAGQWDLVAMVRARVNEELAEIVTNHLLQIDTIIDTTTLIAFRTHSDYDLDRTFSLGMDA